MKRFEDALRTALFAGGVVFLVGALAPSSAGFQRPPPAKDGGLVEAHEACLGHGKGEVMLPAADDEGRMSGVLLDCEGVRWFKLEALMTGCMPGAIVGTPGYEFGGLYGKLWKLGGAPDPWIGAAASYGIQGTWQLFDEGQGTFQADVLQFTDTGRLDVVGNIYGKFAVHNERPLGATLLFGDAQVPAKTTKSRYGDAASVPRKTRPESPYGDAASVTPEPSPWSDAATAPRKVYPKTPYSEARNKTVDPNPWGDAASVPRKVYPKTPFRDATTGPAPLQVGTFYLRFHLDG